MCLVSGDIDGALQASQHQLHGPGLRQGGDLCEGKPALQCSRAATNHYFHYRYVQIISTIIYSIYRKEKRMLKKCSSQSPQAKSGILKLLVKST